MQGHLAKGIETPMAHGRSTKIISMMKWIRTSRLSKKISLFYPFRTGFAIEQIRYIFLETPLCPYGIAYSRAYGFVSCIGVSFLARQR